MRPIFVIYKYDFAKLSQRKYKSYYAASQYIRGVVTLVMQTNDAKKFTNKGEAQKFAKKLGSIWEVEEL